MSDFEWYLIGTVVFCILLGIQIGKQIGNKGDSNGQ